MMTVLVMLNLLWIVEAPLLVVTIVILQPEKKDLSLKSVFHRLKTCALNYLTLEFFVCLNMCHQDHVHVRVIVRGKGMEKIGPRLAILFDRSGQCELKCEK